MGMSPFTFPAGVGAVVCRVSGQPAKRQPIVAAPSGGVTEAGKAGSAIADVAGACLRAGVVRGLGDAPGSVGGLFGKADVPVLDISGVRGCELSWKPAQSTDPSAVIRTCPFVIAY